MYKAKTIPKCELYDHPIQDNLHRFYNCPVARPAWNLKTCNKDKQQNNLYIILYNSQLPQKNPSLLKMYDVIMQHATPKRDVINQ